MGSATKLKACYACTNGKRKCDKAQPICGRCSDRDVECRYPPTKRKRVHTSSAPGAENGGESAGRLSVGPPSLMQIPFSTPNDGLIDLNQWAASLSNWDALPAAELPNDSPATSSETISRLSSQKDPVDFFLRPEAWAIRHIPFTTPSFPNSVCMNYIHGIHEFFTEWVTNSHSPFVHNQLYADAGLPPSIQDAFTCIILHNSKTPANETVIDELLASKTSALLKAYCPDLVGPEVSLGIREHLSRTQALFVHLVLALFSPSISARANAEQQIQTLLSWTRQLWEAALRDPDIGLPCDGGDRSAAAASANGIILDSIFDGDPIPRKWRSWVLSESIRRIWLLATSTIGVYFTLKQKWAECHGGIYFTAHKDLWEAKTGFAWAAACRKADPLFICSLDCEGLFLSAKASDVDPMLVNMFTIMWGVERVENWVARTCEPGDEVKVWRGTDLPMEKGRIAPS